MKILGTLLNRISKQNSQIFQELRAWRRSKVMRESNNRLQVILVASISKAIETQTKLNQKYNKNHNLKVTKETKLIFNNRQLFHKLLALKAHLLIQINMYFKLINKIIKINNSKLRLKLVWGAHKILVRLIINKPILT
jgi:hypothetical protein